eukprot:364284-Chlamydomonas_euryale.AAC.9
MCRHADSARILTLHAPHRGGPASAADQPPTTQLPIPDLRCRTLLTTRRDATRRTRGAVTVVTRRRTAGERSSSC